MCSAPGGPVGAIEGFYGTPWSWEERAAVCRGIAAAGGDTYVYAPKDDPLHRDRWREPYPDAEVAEFATLAAIDGVRVGFAISPGLSIDPSSDVDRAALAAKVEQMTDVGIDLVVLALDDLPFRDGLGREHGRLTAWLRERVDPAIEVALVPNHYTGCVDAPYLAQLRETAPLEVAIGWTGPLVVCDRITVADVDAWTEVMDGRRPLLWDNYPVNDMVMADRLFLGPLRGRDAGVAARLGGYLANGGVQAMASIPPIRSAVAWARGEDPVIEWDAAIGDAAVLGRCVDEVALDALIDACDAGGGSSALDSLGAFLDAAAQCSDGALGPQVAPWVDAVRAEAGVGRSAVSVLQAMGAGDDVSMLAMVMGATWPALRRSSVSVFGPRSGFRPALSHDADGSWVCHPESFDHDRNAIDRLVRLAIGSLQHRR